MTRGGDVLPTRRADSTGHRSCLLAMVDGQGAHGRGTRTPVDLAATVERITPVVVLNFQV